VIPFTTQVRHDTNICGDLATFTFDVSSYTHMLDNGNTFFFDEHESFKYTLVFDDPALGTWAAHGGPRTSTSSPLTAERCSRTRSTARKGPIQIIQHVVFHIDADGNVRVDRTFEKIGDC
jgi:hypothetical protein